MKNPFSEESIVRFIRDTMLDTERLTFEKELETNPTLQQEVQNTRLALLAIDRRGAQILKQRFVKLEKKSLIKKWIYILLAAISVIVLGFVMKKEIFQKKQDNFEHIYADNFEKYRPPVTIRNAENPVLNISNATEAYVNSEYKKAFDLFNVACNEINQEACFYAVLSAIYEGDTDYDQAMNTLIERSAYSAIVLWYQAIFNIKQNRKNEAIKDLEELVGLGTYKKEESLRILKQLRQVEE